MKRPLEIGLGAGVIQPKLLGTGSLRGPQPRGLGSEQGISDGMRLQMIRGSLGFIHDPLDVQEIDELNRQGSWQWK